MNLDISLSEELTAFVGGKVRAGHYASASDVVQAALRLMQPQEEARLKGLRETFQKGLADADAGRTIPLEQAFSEIRADLRRRVVKLEDFTPEEMALIMATEPVAESDT